MNRDQILKLSSMPASSPSYPLPPFRFINREYMTVIYESDPDAIRLPYAPALVPSVAAVDISRVLRSLRP